VIAAYTGLEHFPQLTERLLDTVLAPESRGAFELEDERIKRALS
jgi:hypothetical protein